MQNILELATLWPTALQCLQLVDRTDIRSRFSAADSRYSIIRQPTNNVKLAVNIVRCIAMLN